MVLSTSPGTKVAQKKARKTEVVVIEAARCDLVKQRDACGWMYGILAMILKQYAKFPVTNNQLKHPVRNKIDADAQLPNKLFPTIICQDNLASPMSTLTRKIASNNTLTRTMTMSTGLLVDSTTIK